MNPIYHTAHKILGRDGLAEAVNLATEALWTCVVRNKDFYWSGGDCSSSLGRAGQILDSLDAQEYSDGGSVKAEDFIAYDWNDTGTIERLTREIIHEELSHCAWDFETNQITVEGFAKELENFVY